MNYGNYWDNPQRWLWSLLAMGRSGPALTIDFDIVSPRRHDWPSNGSGPLGSECCDSVIITQPAGTPLAGAAAMQRYTFPPWKANVPNGGDGGDLVTVTSDGWIKIFATQDGGHPGQLYYFVGPGMGMPDDGRLGGWVIGNADVPWQAWKGVNNWLAQAYPTPWNVLGQPTEGYTRYLRDVISIPALAAGMPAASIRVDCMVSEHYSTADPTQAFSMERFLYGAGYGLLLWQAYSTVDPVTPGAVDRAPNTPYCFPTSIPLNPNLYLTDARTYTNFVSDDPFQIFPNAGWPTGAALP